MFLSLIGLFNNPLEMLALVISFMSALFICMPAHEFAHAHAAFKEGDHTAKALKRYTLAPFAHIDLTGFLFLLIFGIGFAKPVPVDVRNFKRGRKSELRVACAGILVNLLLGIISCLLYSVILNFFPQVFKFGFIGRVYQYFFVNMISLNFMLAFFNLLPIYPLDGYRVVEALSKTQNGFLRFMKNFSFYIMLILLVTGILDAYITFVADGLAGLVFNGFNYLFGLI